MFFSATHGLSRIGIECSYQDERLYGTASEHSVFYQYNFHSAANIYAGMLQTESPYFQPTPPPPAPFAAAVGLFPGDPDYTCAAGDEFSGCDEAWSVIMTGSENIFIAGAGIYSVSDNLEAGRQTDTAPRILFRPRDKVCLLY